jgi:DNA polymerase III gamma/tau subunit
VPPRERERLRELAGLFGEEDLARFFQILLRAESEMRYALQPRFHLEMALMKLVHAKHLAPLESLLSELSREGSAEKLAAGASRPTPPPPRPSPQKARDAAPPAEPPRPAPPAPALSSTIRAPGPAEDARLASIKARLFDQSKKFLSSCLEHVSGWRFENGEVRFLYARKDAVYADLLRSREQQEALRSVCTQVLGQPVRICVTLEEQGAETHAAPSSARERAERDRGVEAFRKMLGCTLVDVRDLSQE